MARRKTAVLRSMIWLVFFGSLSACGTPESVNNLAKKSSDNAVSLAVSLEQFTRDTAVDAKRRITNIARLTSSIDEARLRQERSIALADKSGSEAVDIYQEIKELADEWAQKEANRKGAGATKRKAVLEDQAILETEATALMEIGGQLLELSKGDSGKSRVTFLIGFAKDVAEELQTAKEEAKSADAGDASPE